MKPGRIKRRMKEGKYFPGYNWLDEERYKATRTKVTEVKSSEVKVTGE